MSENVGIDRHSKLFQKFMKAKSGKFSSEEHRESSQICRVDNNVPSKQNLSIVSNQLEEKKVDLSQSRVSAKRGEVNRSAVVESGRKKEVELEGRNHKYVNNSLNMGNGMGLDKILKRAIQKVRESRVQDFVASKSGISKDHQGSLQNSRKQQKEMKRVENNETDKGYQKMQMKEENIASHNLKENRLKSCEQSISTEKKQRIDRLTSKVRQLEDDLQAQRQISKKKAKENNKLMQEVNRQIAENEDLQKQIEKLLIESRQFDKITTEKEKQIKKHSDDANYWRNQFEIASGKLQPLQQASSSLEKRMQAVQSESMMMKKEIDGKDQQIVDLNIAMKKLGDENQQAKQYLYQMTIKLYKYECQLSQYRGVQIHHEKQVKIPEKQGEEEVRKLSQPARKRQFSRQRTTSSRIEQKQKQEEAKTVLQPEPKLSQPHPQPLQTDTSRQAKIAQLQTELLQLQELKYVNGKIRRRKIQLQRELEQIKK